MLVKWWRVVAECPEVGQDIIDEYPVNGYIRFRVDGKVYAYAVSPGGWVDSDFVTQDFDRQREIEN